MAEEVDGEMAEEMNGEMAGEMAHGYEHLIL